REHVLQVVELARRIQQRLGRNAAHAQAGAAERGLAVLADAGVDAGHLHAQLRGADRGVVAGGAGTDDDDVELFCHVDSLLIPFPRAGRCPKGGWGPGVRTAPAPAFPEGEGSLLTAPAPSGPGSRAGS